VFGLQDCLVKQKLKTVTVVVVVVVVAAAAAAAVVVCILLGVFLKSLLFIV